MPVRARRAARKPVMTHNPEAPTRRRAELAEATCLVRVEQLGHISLLDLGQFGIYAFDARTRSTSVVAAPPDANDLALAVEGPVRLHTLAHDGIHVLHASAIALRDGRAIALTAASGTGKSTFAALAQTQGWQRLADDLLPLTRDGDAWVARPHLAQPKLADHEQYPADAPRDVPLAAIVELARGPAARWDDYDSSTVTRLLLAGTVATRTYTAPMLAAHLDFCAAAGRAAAAGQLVAGRLTVADRPDAIGIAIDEALALIAGRIARGAAALASG
jgi:hypothetical protein